MPDSFDAPVRLWLLLAVGALVVGYLVQVARRGQVSRRWSTDALRASSVRSRPGLLRHLPPLLAVLALVSMATAFAGPRQEREVQRERATVVVALDTSSSMLAEDVAPDRFSAAKQAARDFVADLPERFDVGLVSFHGTATLQVPPTEDHARIEQAIEGLALSGGTALGDAIDLSRTALTDRSGPPLEPNRAQQPIGAVVLLADGGSTTGTPLPLALQRAADAGVPVSTIAYGTPEGIVVSGGRTFEVPVDTATLADVARQTGGRAYTAATARELTGAYDDIGGRLRTTTEQQDVSASFAGVALALLLSAAATGLARR